MEKDEQIREGLKKLAAEVGPVQTILVKVVSVDVEEKTCEVMDDEVIYYDVRLRPVLNGKECITIFPKIDTWVLILRIEEDHTWQVVSVDEADKVRVVTDTTQFEIGEGFLIKKDADTLKDALTLIIESIQKIIVMEGSNPDRIKLAQALIKVNNLLR